MLTPVNTPLSSFISNLLLDRSSIIPMYDRGGNWFKGGRFEFGWPCSYWKGQLAGTSSLFVFPGKVWRLAMFVLEGPACGNIKSLRVPGQGLEAGHVRIGRASLRVCDETMASVVSASIQGIDCCARNAVLEVRA